MARKYKLKRRAERQEATRDRIIQATVDLHTTIGPMRTSILSIAERAGVERPTVYRHFPTQDDLFGACSAHYMAQSPPPDPEAWLLVNDPEARLRRALAELYEYYSAQDTGLWNILRDLEDFPDLRRFASRRRQHNERMRQVLATAFEGAKDHELLDRLIGHALDFFAWRSLRRQCLTNEQSIDVMLALIRTAAS